MKSLHNDNELSYLTSYISLWGWQILAMLFLCSSFIVIALPRNLFGFIFGIAFFLTFVLCEYKSLKRKQEFYNEIQANP